MGLFNTFVEAMFPRTCFFCYNEGGWICAACLTRLPIEERSLATGVLDQLTTFFDYQKTKSIGKLIQAFKYNRAHDIATALPSLWQAILIKSDFKKRVNDFSGACVLPVPLYKRRYNDRGFNQAEYLAKTLSERLELPLLSEGLIRQFATNQQAKLSKVERLKNLQGAFIWQGANPPARVILVDDVYTTGATMQECAKALKSAGVEEVWGVALARD